MIPERSFGFLCVLVAAACTLALCFMAFQSPAAAASSDVRPYRGYADVTIRETGRNMQRGSVQTRDVFDTKAECEHVTIAALNDYAEHVMNDRPGAQFASQVACRYARNAYFA